MEKGGRQFRVVNMPAISEEGVPDAMNRRPGQPLWPSRYPLEWLHQQRLDIGPYFWSAQYQQKPTSVEQQIIKPEWWRYYRMGEDRDLLPTPLFVMQSWDTAFKTGESNDYSVCVTWYVTDPGFYVVDFFRDRLDYPRLKSECMLRASRWNPNLIVVEDKASGQSLVQSMKAETRLPIKAVPPAGDKVQRLHLQSGYWEAGKVFLPEDAPWTQTILDEFAEFPKGPHDDIVDAFSLGMEQLRRRLRLLPASAVPARTTEPREERRRPPRRDSTYLKGFG
jgi:predicted phage terminase large subunit-like protein